MKMSCARCRASLPQLLDEYGRIRPYSEVAAHLAACPDCARELALLQSLRNETRAIGIAAAPPQLRANVRAALEAEAHATRQQIAAPRADRFSLFAFARRPAFTWSSGVALAAFALFITMREPMPPLEVPVSTSEATQDAAPEQLSAPSVSAKSQGEKVAPRAAAKKPEALAKTNAARRPSSLARELPASAVAPSAPAPQNETFFSHSAPSSANVSRPTSPKPSVKKPSVAKPIARPAAPPRDSSSSDSSSSDSSPSPRSRAAQPIRSLETFATAAGNERTVANVIVNDAERVESTATRDAALASRTKPTSSEPLAARIALLPRQSAARPDFPALDSATPATTMQSDGAPASSAPARGATGFGPAAPAFAPPVPHETHKQDSRLRAESNNSEAADSADFAPSFPSMARGGGLANSYVSKNGQRRAPSAATAKRIDEPESRVAAPPRLTTSPGFLHRSGATTYSAPFSLATPQLSLAANETRRAMLVVTPSRDAKNVRLCVTRDGLEIGGDVLWRGDANKGRDIVVPVALRALRAGTVRAVISLETLDGTILASQTVEAFAAP